MQVLDDGRAVGVSRVKSHDEASDEQAKRSWMDGFCYVCISAMSTSGSHMDRVDLRGVWEKKQISLSSCEDGCWGGGGWMVMLMMIQIINLHKLLALGSMI
jgi:hypothetical protein